MAGMSWRLTVGLLAVALVIYVFGSTILGSLGIDIHWRGFH
jgi:hypothetical protein